MSDLRKLCLLAGLLALGVPVAGHADQKSDDIARMMSLNGDNISSAEGRLTASVAPVIQRFAEAHPNIPPDARATLQAQIHQQETDLFNAIMAQVRARYYADMTDDDVRAVLAFDETPAGQDYLRESSVIRTMEAVDVTRIVPALLAVMTGDFLAALRCQTPPPQPG
jgi:hypothetical protein